MLTLDSLTFDNHFARLPEAFYSRVAPTPLPAPYLVSFNAAAARLIDLDPAEAQRQDFAEYLAGNRLLAGCDPLAMLYAGHQFGHFVPQLGDGRAILLGAVRNSAGERWELQLKGAGPTPYSRSGDGRAVLRSTIREYLCSEAMHGLGIPTTRALCIVGSDEEVYRETIETGAVLLRMAPSHVRFGSFEVFYHRRQYDEIKLLADFVISAHYPELADTEDRYALLLDTVIQRTARLMAQWQAVGFAHGVMNTDNMSILGLTLDYGPFGFLDSYDPGFICNHSDHHGRYAFDQQPGIGLWNLGRLAQALTPLIPAARCTALLAEYETVFAMHYLTELRAKLGLRTAHPDDEELAHTLLHAMHANRVDYTLLFRALGDFDSSPGARNAALRDQFLERAAFDSWAVDYRTRLAAEHSDDQERRARMNRVNPKYVLRNYLAETAIRRAQARDYSEIDRLLAVLQHPYDEQPDRHSYAAAPPDWAGAIAVSCSS